MLEKIDTGKIIKTGKTMKIPKLFYGWWVVAASIFGFSASPGQFAFGAMSLFMIPLSLEFNWDRTQISLALTIFTVVQAFATPVVGRMVDQYGAKEILIPSVLIFGSLLSTIPLIVSELWHLYLIFFLIGSLTAGSAAVTYLRIIGAWFNKRRGLAFGITMAGGGLGYTYVPPMLQYLIDNFGWRYGYYALAAIVLILSLPLISLVVRNKPADMNLRQDGDAEGKIITPEEDITLTLSQVLKLKTFWLLYPIFTLLSLCLYGLMPHFVPMLQDRGMDTATAALVFSTLGITIIVSRASIGFLLDKYFAPRVAMICVLLSAIGITILAGGAAGGLAFIAAIFVGFSIGAELDLLAYLTTRYFGLGSFGMIYGLLFSAFLLGVSTGPVIYGAAFETFSSYVNILTSCGIILAIAASLMLLLPRYKQVGD